MKRISARQAALNAARKPIARAQLLRFNYCEFKAAGGPGECYGNLSVHEPWSRGRGGPIADARNQVTVCFEHNRMISQNAETMRWATEKGFLVHSAFGADWLAQGGFQR